MSAQPFYHRFIAPADYISGDVIVVKGTELPVMTPGMAAATSDIFKAGAVVHCDIDIDRELAFCCQSSGNMNSGSIPDASYAEQYAGYHYLDGNKVYAKTIEIGHLTSTEQAWPHNIDTSKKVIDMRYWYKALQHPNYDLFGNWGMASNNYILVRASKNGFFTQASSAWLGNVRILIVTIYYTCTDR